MNDVHADAENTVREMVLLFCFVLCSSSEHLRHDNDAETILDIDFLSLSLIVSYTRYPAEK